ncbi:DMT family transporter [Phenylobacterium sp.]|uniref:DMT family transporter n=1 Tax=Phenylobacterium sp. TaxID=1871053 RepID=UPI0035B1C4C0
MTDQLTADAAGAPTQHVGAGILSRVAAMVCMATMFALVKWVSLRGVPVFETLFFRSVFGFLPLAVYIVRAGGMSVMRTTRPVGHLVRAAIGLLGVVGGYMAVAHLPLTEATALQFSAPLFMTALSALILREHVGRHRWAAVAIGFIGVMIMVRPEPTHMANIGTAFALIGAVGSAGAMIAIRQISRTEPGPRIVFYFTVTGMVVGLASAPFGWVKPDPLTLAALVGAGLAGAFGQLLLTQALRLAPVAVVAPFDYTQLLWAGLIAFFAWGEVPRPAMLAGAAVVAASGLYIVYREARLRAAARGR